MYHPDLSLALDELVNQFRLRSWENYDSQKPTRYVGWLDTEHSHAQGEVSKEFLDALREICREPIVRYKGSHQCEYCLQNRVPWSEGHGMLLSSTDIEVVGDIAVYRAPGLILHYVADHQYLPPQEFIDAVLSKKEEVHGKCSRVGFKIDDPRDDYWRWPVAEKPDDQGWIETVFIFRNEGLARLVQKKLHARYCNSEVGAINLEAWVEENVSLKMGELRETTPRDAFPRLKSAFYLQTFSTKTVFLDSLSGVLLTVNQLGAWTRFLRGAYNSDLELLARYARVKVEDFEDDLDFENHRNFVLLIDEFANPEVVSNYVVFQKNMGRLVPEDEQFQERVVSLLKRNAEVIKY